VPQEPPAGPTPGPDADLTGRAGPDEPAEPASVDAPADAPVESAYDLLQRGHALMRRRHNAQAAVVLERASRLEPGKGSILEALARARFNAGQHGAALETFAALLEVDPSSPYAHYGLGRCLRNLGRHGEAGTHLRLAAALAPASPLYRSALAGITGPARPETPATQERRTGREDEEPVGDG